MKSLVRSLLASAKGSGQLEQHPRDGRNQKSKFLLVLCKELVHQLPHPKTINGYKLLMGIENVSARSQSRPSRSRRADRALLSGRGPAGAERIPRYSEAERPGTSSCHCCSHVFLRRV